MGFFGGALSGFAGEAEKKREAGNSRMFNRKKKTPLRSPNSSNTMNLSEDVPSYKRGGKVKKTGLAYVHRGETVVPAKRKRGRSAGKRR
jgi:hypothetical protein